MWPGSISLLPGRGFFVFFPLCLIFLAWERGTTTRILCFLSLFLAWERERGTRTSAKWIQFRFEPDNDQTNKNLPKKHCSEDRNCCGFAPEMWPMNWRGRKTPRPKQKAMPRKPMPWPLVPGSTALAIPPNPINVNTVVPTSSATHTCCSLYPPINPPPPPQLPSDNPLPQTHSCNAIQPTLSINSQIPHQAPPNIPIS